MCKAGPFVKEKWGGYPPRSVDVVDAVQAVLCSSLRIKILLLPKRVKSQIKVNKKAVTKGGIAPSKANSLSVLVETRVRCKESN